MKNIFYIGGLPRSGSTLLCNILAQNGSLYVGKSGSGCSEILHSVKTQWNDLLEHKAEGINDKQLKRVLQSILYTYHYTNNDLIIDKSRNWIALFEMLEFIQGKKPKIIIPVRNMTQVIASFEKIWRKNSGISNFGFSADEYHIAQTLEGRCELWCKNDSPIGLAYNRVKDIISRGHKEDVLFLEFDLLTRNPALTMQKVYNYLELPYYQHNFEHVEQYTKEDDINVHGAKDLHTIRNKVQPLVDDSREILGNELHDKYSNLEVWR